MTDTQPRAPWHKQPGESEPAYQAFLAFRDLGPGRTVAEVSKELAKSRQMIDRWCQRHGWRERAAPWDRDVDERHRRERARRRKQIVDLHDRAATALLAEAAKRLRPIPMIDKDGTILRDAHGEPYLVPLDASELTATANALDKAIRHQRLALGLPTEHTKQDVALRDTLAQTIETQLVVSTIITEQLCHSCRTRVASELGRLVRQQARLGDELA